MQFVLLSGYEDLEACACVKTEICGVDFIIKDIGDPASAQGIIELNYNPAIQMHEYPFTGKSRPAAKAVLDALGF